MKQDETNEQINAIMKSSGVLFVCFGFVFLISIRTTKPNPQLPARISGISVSLRIMMIVGMFCNA